MREFPRSGMELVPQQSSEPLELQCWILNPLSYQGTSVVFNTLFYYETYIVSQLELYTFIFNLEIIS